MHMYEAKTRGGQWKFTPDEIAEKWEKYKLKCDNNVKRRQKTVKTVGDDGVEHKEIIKWDELAPLTYTVDGFCVFLPLSRRLWGQYRENEDYQEICEMIDDECKTNARARFEDGTLNTRLAGIWLGRYPEYRTQQETKISGGVPVVITGESELED
nr:MAG TPA_asm: Terminase small subunit [Caudoviricetes sp.]